MCFASTEYVLCKYGVSSSNLLSPKKNRIEKEKKKKEYLKEGKGREKNDWREWKDIYHIFSLKDIYHIFSLKDIYHIFSLKDYYLLIIR